MMDAVESARDTLERLRFLFTTLSPIVSSGHVTRVTGTVVEADGFSAVVGQYCRIETPDGWRLGEVVGFTGSAFTIMPLGGIQGMYPGALVTPASRRTRVSVGRALLGRVVDATGRPLDGRPLFSAERGALRAPAPNPMRRQRITQPLDVGVRSINALLTVGIGQRIGLFAGSGVGKSVLLGMMARHSQADVVVIGLIGERGREVREFVEDILGDGLRHAVVVVATADMPPILRMRGAEYATAIAEYFRALGNNVLLIMDSLTRYAMAAREVGLAAGELPATKGYPPSVFSALSALTERAGTAEVGAITAFYSVLTEGDDLQDPVADAARAILDGHVVLSRDLASIGQFPAVEPALSASRVMPHVVNGQQMENARHFQALWGRYRERSDLIAIGAYVTGSDALLDAAVRQYPSMLEFLRQSPAQRVSFSDSQQALSTLVEAS
ncbi:FliI/YscN family ATPase [Acidithiobacillus ferrivorans]|jgi:flagellum-specific ATP synthase|nr:FliI/YscN family ATPase [Acidithiobacillus ferrivorans]